MSAQQQIDDLRAELEHHEHLYYVLDDSTLTDAQYDALMNRLKALEAEHPELITPESPMAIAAMLPRLRSSSVALRQ